MPEEIKTAELDPCPFCGSRPRMSKLEHIDKYYIFCPECGIEQGYTYSYTEAIEQWNTRKGE